VSLPRDARDRRWKLAASRYGVTVVHPVESTVDACSSSRSRRAGSLRPLAIVYQPFDRPGRAHALSMAPGRLIARPLVPCRTVETMIPSGHGHRPSARCSRTPRPPTSPYPSVATASTAAWRSATQRTRCADPAHWPSGGRSGQVVGRDEAGESSSGIPPSGVAASRSRSAPPRDPQTVSTNSLHRSGALDLEPSPTKNAVRRKRVCDG